MEAINKFININRIYVEKHVLNHKHVVEVDPGPLEEDDKGMESSYIG